MDLAHWHVDWSKLHHVEVSNQWIGRRSANFRDLFESVMRNTPISHVIVFDWVADSQESFPTEDDAPGTLHGFLRENGELLSHQRPFCWRFSSPEAAIQLNRCEAAQSWLFGRHFFFFRAKPGFVFDAAERQSAFERLRANRVYIDAYIEGWLRDVDFLVATKAELSSYSVIADEPAKIELFIERWRSNPCPRPH